MSGGGTHEPGYYFSFLLTCSLVRLSQTGWEACLTGFVIFQHGSIPFTIEIPSSSEVRMIPLLLVAKALMRCAMGGDFPFCTYCALINALNWNRETMIYGIWYGVSDRGKMERQ